MYVSHVQGVLANGDDFSRWVVYSYLADNSDASKTG